MRKMISKRHYIVSRIAAILLLFVSVIFHPAAGMSSTEPTRTTSDNLTDNAVIAPAKEAETITNSTPAKAKPQTESESKTAAQNIAESLKAAAAKCRAKEEDTASQVKAGTFDSSIHKALKKHGQSTNQIEIWSAEHPNSTLHKIKNLDSATQKKVANVATFIRKVNSSLSVKTAWREASALVYYSVKYKVPLDIVVAIAKQESKFNPSAQSRSGALGVMQVVWKVHNGMLRSRGIAPTRNHMFDPERGVEAGVLILSRYIKAYGSLQSALNRYYGGFAKVYIKKVNNNVAMLKRHVNDSGY